MIDNLHTQDVRQKLYAGIKKTADAVRVTMGTSGSNAVIEAMENPGHYITNDGWSIANAIRLADPIEEMGRKILMEAINRANRASGDGSSTTCVLTEAIVAEGMKVEDISPMELKRSLENCIKVIEESLESQKREITVHEVGAVAAISAEDESIGAIIQEIYEQIGPKGLIYWDVSKTAEDTYTIGKGITIDAGYASPYMCDMEEKSGTMLSTVRWQKPAVIITKQKITTAADFEKIFYKLNSFDMKEVLIFCDEIDAVAIGQLVQTRLMRGFKTVVVKLPTIFKDHWFIDLAHATGATVIDPVVGLTLKDMDIGHIGHVENVLINKDETHIDGIKDITEHVKMLEDEGTNEAALRVARLNQSTARYYVGAHSDSALAYKRLKVEDAISSAYHALNGGVVAGGGSALAFIANTHGQMAESYGWQILREALKAPAKQIALNAGHPDLAIGDNYDNINGFDSKRGEFVNMFDAHITDPAVIVLNAAKNAISVAATVLTASTVVTLPKTDHE